MWSGSRLTSRREWLMLGEPLLNRQLTEWEVLAPLLVDEREARRLLGGLCPKTMYNLRQQGLPFIKVGSRVMYAPADLAGWIERQKGGLPGRERSSTGSEELAVNPADGPDPRVLASRMVRNVSNGDNR
jgi:hypothetical protein